MALKDDLKVFLRVKSDAFDVEIDTLIAAAKTDLMRRGVPESALADGSENALVKQAIILYVKAYFGYDNDEADRFLESYEQTAQEVSSSLSMYEGEQ